MVVTEDLGSLEAGVGRPVPILGGSLFSFLGKTSIEMSNKSATTTTTTTTVK